jgi:hypothetical protein
VSIRSNARKSKRIVYTTNGYIDGHGEWHAAKQRHDKDSSPRGTPGAKLLRNYQAHYPTGGR